MTSPIYSAWAKIANSASDAKRSTPRMFALCVPEWMRDAALTVGERKVSGMVICGVLIGSVKR